LEAGVKLRRRAWQGRELPLAPEVWPLVADERPSPGQSAEMREVLIEIQEGIERELTPHQREVFTALALNDVPIDVLAERLATTRGALFPASSASRSSTAT
jgi:RNA polymerase sigma-70 factor, ECF subfamily